MRPCRVFVVDVHVFSSLDRCDAFLNGRHRAVLHMAFLSSAYLAGLRSLRERDHWSRPGHPRYRRSYRKNSYRLRSIRSDQVAKENEATTRKCFHTRYPRSRDSNLQNWLVHHWSSAIDCGTRVACLQESPCRSSVSSGQSEGSSQRYRRMCLQGLSLTFGVFFTVAAISVK